LDPQVADTGPSACSQHAMAFDAKRHRTVLFRGGPGGASAETWEWDGEEWTQIEDTGPSPRLKHAMTYDSLVASISVEQIYGTHGRGMGILGPKSPTSDLMHPKKPRSCSKARLRCCSAAWSL